MREYKDHHVDSRDVSIELPTGTGKSLTGLLIAEWCRREHEAPVPIACPNTELSRQLHSVAIREGIGVSLLIGAASSWDWKDKIAYETGQQVAVTTYNSIFNSNPKIAQPRNIVFDDARAGEQHVGDKYAVNIKRTESADLYRNVVAAFAGRRRSGYLSSGNLACILMTNCATWLADHHETRPISEMRNCQTSDPGSPHPSVGRAKLTPRR